VKILASLSPGEMRVAAWDGGLRDYAVWRPGAPDGVGDIHRGRILARVPALAGAFVALEGAEGFLPESESLASEGSVVGVRLVRAAQGGKGPRLSARLTPEEQALIGSGPPARVAAGPDALMRMAAWYPDAPVLIDDAGAAARFPGAFSLVARAFDDAVEVEVEALGQPVCALPGGARLSVYPTPALVALDVDLGSSSAGRERKHQSQLTANRHLLPALCRQIRLRNLSGALLVDLAGLTAKRRKPLGADFAQALSADPLQPRFLGFTALGLAEIVRPRVHPPLHEVLAGAHAQGLAALRALALHVAAEPHLSPVLRVRPEIATALRADPIALAALAHRAGRAVVLREDRLVPQPGWALDLL